VRRKYGLFCHAVRKLFLMYFECFIFSIYDIPVVFNGIIIG
jgi:hypothetical protein